METNCDAVSIAISKVRPEVGLVETRASKLTRLELGPKKFSGVFLVSTFMGDIFLGLAFTAFQVTFA